MGVDIFARSTDGCTAYSLAVKSNRSVELVEYLAIRRGWLPCILASYKLTISLSLPFQQLLLLNVLSLIYLKRQKRVGYGTLIPSRVESF